MISVSLYPAFALDTSQTCDASILPPRWPSSHIYITDTNESLPYVPLTAHTAIFHDDDVWNTSIQPRDVNVTLTIKDQDTGQQIFNQTQSVQVKACSGPESVKWRFVPTQIANYIATVSDNRGNVGMIFNSMLDATKSQTVSSPLEQLRFGIDSHDVVCRQGLQFIMKNENGQPACVTSHTMDELINRGWGIVPLAGLPIYHNTSIFDTGIHPFSINVTNTNFTLNYNISGNNKLLDANIDSSTKSLVLSMSASSNGTLSISIPRALLDSKSAYSNQDTKFIILIDKQEVKYTEITSITARTLTIPFELNAKKIEITAPVNI